MIIKSLFRFRPGFGWGALLLTLLCPLGIFAQASPGTEAILREIAARLGEGDFEGALARFGQIPSPEVESPRIQLIKASVLSSAGRHAEARAAADRVLRADPENADALFVLASVEGTAGREKEQRAALEGVLRAAPNHVEALIALGNLNSRNNSPRAAAGYFDRALALEPENLEALIGRAGIYRLDHDPKNAEALLNRAVSVYPESSLGWSERGRLYKGMGFPAYALADLDKAKTLAPDDYWIACDRGRTLLDLNRKDEALAELERAISLDPDNFFAYVFSAGIRNDFRDYEGAERDYVRLSKLRPDYYFAFEAIGMYRMKQGRWLEARDAFMEAYRQAPKERTYALLAAINWMRGERLNSPKTFLAQVLRGIPRDTLEWYVFRLYHDLAGDNDVTRRLDQEKNLYTKAQMLFYLASYYDIRGNKNLADRYFVQIRELGDNKDTGRSLQNMLEWQLNEWTLEERHLAGF
jgi:tetratricopeptide (TPR) repeat protein